MSTKTTIQPGPEERRFTVRKHRSRRCLARDADGVWFWAPARNATPMTRTEADAAVARMGGVVLFDGTPVDQVGAPKPKRPAPVPGKAPGEPDTKLERLQRLVAAEDWYGAFKLGASVGRQLGDDRETIQRAWEAMQRPDFVRELHRDPDALIEAGKAALRRRYGGKKR